MTRRLAKDQSKERRGDKVTININPLLKRKPMDSESKTYLTLKLTEAAADGDMKRAKALLSEGADINGENLEWPPLVMAAVRRKTEMVIFLGESGANLEAKESVSGRTALHWAAANGFFECVIALINMNATTRAIDDMKSTPHELAIQNRHYQVAEFLEEK